MVEFSSVTGQGLRWSAAERPASNVIQPTADSVRSAGTIPSRLLGNPNDHKSHARTCPAVCPVWFFGNPTVEFSLQNGQVLRRWGAPRPTTNAIQPTADSVRSAGTLPSRLLGSQNDHESHARTYPVVCLPRFFWYVMVEFSVVLGQVSRRWSAPRPTPNAIQPTADSVRSVGALPNRLSEGPKDYESHARTCPAFTLFRWFRNPTVEFSSVNGLGLRGWTAARPTPNALLPTANSVRSAGTLPSRTCPAVTLFRLF